MTVRPICNMVLRYFLIMIICTILIFTTNGCRKKQNPPEELTEEQKAYLSMTEEEQLIYDLNMVYPYKTFVVEETDKVRDPLNPGYGMDTATVTCVEDGITFNVSPSTGPTEYQRKLWNKQFRDEVNKTLTELYGDSYILHDNDTSFRAYGGNNDTPDKEDDDDWKYNITKDDMSTRYLNTSYDEAFSMLSNQEIVDPSNTRIFFHVFTDAVDKEKEMDNIRELYKQFILPIKDEPSIVASSKNGYVDHKRDYLIEIRYIDPSQKENIYIYETTDYTKLDRITYDNGYKKYTESSDNYINKFKTIANISSEIITEEDLTDEELIKHFEK